MNFNAAVAAIEVLRRESKPPNQSRPAVVLHNGTTPPPDGDVSETGRALTRHALSNGEVEGPGIDARSEPRAHTVSSRPRRDYRASRHPPTIVRSPPLLPEQVRTRPDSQGDNPSQTNLRWWRLPSWCIAAGAEGHLCHFKDAPQRDKGGAPKCEPAPRRTQSKV